MTSNALSQLLKNIARDPGSLLSDWTKEHARHGGRTAGMSDAELRDQSREFVGAFAQAAVADMNGTTGSAWTPVREFLNNLARTRTIAGAAPSDVAGYILSLKRPLFARLKEGLTNPVEVVEATWILTDLIDDLALFTTEVFQKSREGVIQRQQQEMLELSTPVVKLWDGILALPMIGTLDSGRTQVVMESLLQRIVETGAEIAILDITGVPTVDTLVAQHLLKTVTAARLMGADCIISGIRPQIAQTIVHLGVDLQDVITKATMADAFALALRRKSLRVTRVGTGNASAASNAL